MASPHTVLTNLAISTTAIGTAIWGATQWIAAEFGFHAALGTPWISVFGVPIYSPWSFFAWWISFEHVAPQAFLIGGSIIAGSAVVSGTVVHLRADMKNRSNHKPTTYGSARWATAKDIRTAGLTGDHGVMLGTVAGRYLRHDGPEHVLTVAPTRSGKGVGLVVPTLLSWAHSTIVHDIKGENWALTAGWRSQFSNCIRFDPTSQATARFNPLLEVRKGSYEVSDAQNIADILVDPEGEKHPDHWDKTAHALLTGAVLHVLYAEDDKTLHGVATFLSNPVRTLDETLDAMLTTNHVGTPGSPKAHPTVASSARALLNMSDNERSSVVSTAVRALTLYRDPIIATATAASDWSIRDITGEGSPVSLYLVVPPSDLSRTRPLMRLILNQILRRLTEDFHASGGTTRRQKLLLMLDEFPALGRLPFFENALAFLAGYDVRAMLIAQSLNQIDKAYGTNNAILDNCHVRVAFASNDERTAKRISDALGTATELRAQENLSGSRTALWLHNKTVTIHETPRPLLTPGEVMQLPADQELVLISGVPPIRAAKIRSYADRAFVERHRPAPRDSLPENMRRDGSTNNDWNGLKCSTDQLAAVVVTDDAIDENTPEARKRKIRSSKLGDLSLLEDEPDQRLRREVKR